MLLGPILLVVLDRRPIRYSYRFNSCRLVQRAYALSQAAAASRGKRSICPMHRTTSAQPPLDSSAANSFVWEPEGGKVAIHLSGDLVDRLNYEVMRGFGAVPKRGAEVGGILLGTVEKGEKSVVRVDELINIPCEHLRGPSYILSEADLPGLDRALAERSSNSIGKSRAVGFFRSNTRELMQLSEDDLAVLEARFPDEASFCLLVRPFATRPSEALFLTRQDGRFPVGEQNNSFTFRRKEMNLPPAPKRERGSTPAFVGTGSMQAGIGSTASVEDGEPAMERDSPRMGRLRSRHDPHPAVGTGQEEGSRLDFGPNLHPFLARSDANPVPGEVLSGALDVAELNWEAPPPPVKSRLWLWVPLCFVLLAFGVFVVVQAPSLLDADLGGSASMDPYELGLNVSRFGGSFNLRWNPELQALRQARSGEMLIEDGTACMTQALTAADLSRGGMIYRGGANLVRFRLTLFLRDRVTFTETVEAPTPKR